MCASLNNICDVKIFYFHCSTNASTNAICRSRKNSKWRRFDTAAILCCYCFEAAIAANHTFSIELCESYINIHEQLIKFSSETVQCTTNAAINQHLKEFSSVFDYYLNVTSNWNVLNKKSIQQFQLMTQFNAAKWNKYKIRPPNMSCTDIVMNIFIFMC